MVRDLSDRSYEEYDFEIELVFQAGIAGVCKLLGGLRTVLNSTD